MDLGEKIRLPEEITAAALKGISAENLKKYYSSKIVEGFESISGCPKVTEGLLGRGYSREDGKKIMGGQLDAPLRRSVGMMSCNIIFVSYFFK